MIVRVMDAPGVPGGKALCLCDDAGQVLPLQTKCVLQQSVAEPSSITVTFLIDGDRVRMVD